MARGETDPRAPLGLSVPSGSSDGDSGAGQHASRHDHAVMGEQTGEKKARVNKFHCKKHDMQS